jgi:hypothetical protein
VLYAVAALSLFALSCNKDDEVMDKVDVPDRGRIRFINISGDLYDYYVDNTKIGDIYGRDTIIVPNLTVGVHRVKAIQTSNLAGAPQLRQEDKTVIKDSVVTFIFP